MDVDVADETYYEGELWVEREIPEGVGSLEFTVTSETGCLYIGLSSFQEGIEYKLLVEEE